MNRLNTEWAVGSSNMPGPLDTDTTSYYEEWVDAHYAFVAWLREQADFYEWEDEDGLALVYAAAAEQVESCAEEAGCSLFLDGRYWWLELTDHLEWVDDEDQPVPAMLVDDGGWNE